MKFTEEQYREIIRTYENNSGYDNKATAVIRVVDNFNDSLSYNEAFALANPVTREWAHDRFVEEEKKYVWGTQTINGVRYVLVKKDGVYSMKDRYSHYYEAIPLTETEVKSLKFLDFRELFPEEVE